MLQKAIRQLLPKTLVPYARRLYRRHITARINALPPLTEEIFRTILSTDLGIKAGDVVFIHSSIDRLHLAFPFYRILPLLQQAVGQAGTLLFPTYPRLPSYEYLLSKEVFDVKNTPSYTGILTELARKQKQAVRSLHPTKSVCAIGKLASTLTDSHQESPYPYDYCSPYYKIIDFSAKIIGLGVTTRNLSFVHCIDDALKENFPLNPYHKQLFRAQCINYSGNIEMVNTYAHNLKVLHHNIPRYMHKYVPENICRDMTLHGMNFFRAGPQALFPAMQDLAKKRLTIYNP
jgi:aminoglycoside 3-N-acetyltransferase